MIKIHTMFLVCYYVKMSEQNKKNTDYNVVFSQYGSFVKVGGSIKIDTI